MHLPGNNLEGFSVEYEVIAVDAEVVSAWCFLSKHSTTERERGNQENNDANLHGFRLLAI
jgi:hypothetical protein